MTIDAYITLIIIVLMLLGLAFDILAQDVIVFSALGLLILTGVLTPSEALIGFSNKGMLTVAILFVVAYAAQSSGILEFFAIKIMGRSRGGKKSILRLMVPVIGMSAFLNNTPIVAMFTPTVRDWALKNRLSPSKYLIPLSYASIFGGICTLIGTSTNLVVNGFLLEANLRPLGMFELGKIGIPCAMAGLFYMVFFGYRLLPENKDLAVNISESGREYLVEMSIQANSPLIGKTVESAGLRNLTDLFLVQIHQAGRVLSPVKPSDRLNEGDHLCFAGTAGSMSKLSAFQGLVPRHEESFCSTIQQSGKGKLVEAVVSRSSPMLDKTIKEGNFRARYDAAVLSIYRNGEKLEGSLGKIVLRPGDTLLLLTGDDFVKRWNHSREFYLVSKATEFPAVNPRKTLVTLLTLTGMIALSTFGILPIFQAAVLAAIVLLFTRCLTPVEARRSLEINVLVVIACAFGISKALDKSGAAQFIASRIIDAVRDFGPVGLLAAVYLCTSLMTEVITNNAAAALVFPIALSASGQMGVDPMPFAIAIALGASASFATPIGYQTNLMVCGPGGYRFLDFLKIGTPLNILFMAASLFIIPLIWTF